MCLSTGPAECFRPRPLNVARPLVAPTFRRAYEPALDAPRYATPKVPEIEQLLSAGCAAHAVLLASHALGFGAIWRTGPVTYLPGLNPALGLAENERVVAFLYLGTIAGTPKPLPEHDFDDFIGTWEG